MSGVGSENAGRAWVLAKVAEKSTMKAAVTAIAKLNRKKKPKKAGPSKGWYIVRADELDLPAHLMIVVDADLPGTLDDVIANALSPLKELEIVKPYRVKVKQLDDGTWQAFHHPHEPHQGDWDEVEKPDAFGPLLDPGSDVPDPDKPEGPRPNPRNPWG